MARLLALIASVLHPVAAGAQPRAEQDTTAGVLRPEREVRTLAERAAQVLERRHDGGFVVGPAPPPGLPEAVAEGEIALVARSEAVQLVRRDFDGEIRSVRLSTRATAPAALPRAVALAVESLRDATHSNERNPRSRPADSASHEFDHANALGRLDTSERYGKVFEHPKYEPAAKPTIYLRLLLGASPLRGTPLLGPGVGLGLCVDGHCVVIEGDLSLLPQHARGQDGTEVTYRSVNASVRAQLRPFEWGAFVPGVTFGLLSRMGTATVVETDVSRFVTNLGFRSSGEIAWRFAAPFEWVLEAGVDVALTRARFVGPPETVFLEDRWTPWIVTGPRVRP